MLGEKELGAVKAGEGQGPRGAGSVVPIHGATPEVPWSTGGGCFPGCEGDCGHSWWCLHEAAQDSQRLR